MRQAACEGCAKVWRVPSTDRIFRCRACGGVVRASTEPSAPFDEELHAVAVPTLRAKTTRRDIEHKSTDPDAELKQIQRALDQFHKLQVRSRILLGIIMALGVLISLVVVLFVLPSTGTYQAPLTLLLAAFLSLYIWSWISVPKLPRAVAIVLLAAPLTELLSPLFVRLFGVKAPIDVRPSIVGLLIIALLASWLLAMAKLQDRWPELIGAYRGKRLIPLAPSRRIAARKLHQRATRSAALVASGIFLAANMALDASLFHGAEPERSNAPALGSAKPAPAKVPPADFTLEAFVQRWPEASMDEIGGYCLTGPSGDLAQNLAEAFERRDWLGSRPAIEIVQLEPRGDSNVRVEFDAGGVMLRTRWTYDGRAWKIESLRFPRE